MLSKLSPRRGGIRPFRRAHMAMLTTSVALALILGPIAGLEWARAETTGTETNITQLPSLSPLVKKVMPAVVNISVLETATADQSADVSPNPQPGLPQGA